MMSMLNCVSIALRVTAFVSVENISLTSCVCLCPPPSLWLSLCLAHPLSLWQCNVPWNRQFCQPTSKVALASANWTDLLWVPPVAVGFCLSGYGTLVSHCWFVIMLILPEIMILPNRHHIKFYVYIIKIYALSIINYQQSWLNIP